MGEARKQIRIKEQVYLKGFHFKFVCYSSKTSIPFKHNEMLKLRFITKTSPCNVNVNVTPNFYLVKLAFRVVYLLFLFFFI